MESNRHGSSFIKKCQTPNRQSNLEKEESKRHSCWKSHSLISNYITKVMNKNSMVWGKNRDIPQWNTEENQEINSCIKSQLICNKNNQEYTMEKGQSLQ